MKEKGQLTTFIIIGLVLLLVIVLTIYFLQYKPTVPPIKVDENILPVYTQVYSCIKSLAIEGINRLGLQGGYINIPPFIKNNHFAKIDLTSSGSFSIPYWYYEGKSRIPSAQQMKTELSLYVKDKLKDCVDFKALENFEVEETGELKVNTFFEDKEVVVDVKWPLRIKTLDKIYDQENYRAEINVELKKVHELAERIMTAENKQEFLEKATINLMSGNPNIPMDGLDTSCSPKKWYLKDIENYFKQLITYNLPHIRIDNTETLDYILDIDEYYKLKKINERMEKELNALQDYDINDPLSAVKTPTNEAPPDAFDYNNLRFNVDTPTTKLQVGFYFNPNWNIMFNAQPSDNGVLSSSVVRGERKFLKFFCTNQYHFTYDIIYPVIVSIRDPTAFNNEGYIFQFAFPVLINNNHGDRKNFGLKRFVSAYYDEEYCNKLSEGTVEFTVRGFEEGIPIATELEDVSIDFICGPKLCPLGKTKSREGSYSLKTSLPEGCGNPTIRASKEGYLPTQKTLLNGQKSLDLEITKLKTFNLDVIKYEYDKYDKKLINPSRLNKNEELFIYVYSPDNKDFSQYIIYPEQLTLDLIGKDSTYNFEVYLKRKGLGTLLGGKILENVKINYEEFADKNTIVLKTLQMTPLPTSDEEQALMYEVISNEEFKNELRPEFR